MSLLHFLMRTIAKTLDIDCISGTVSLMVMLLLALSGTVRERDLIPVPEVLRTRNDYKLQGETDSHKPNDCVDSHQVRVLR